MIRLGVASDIERLLEIYNYEVVNGTATLDLTPRTLEEWKEWFSVHSEPRHPLLVMEEEGVIQGYATLSTYREKEAFISTVELSVYVAPECRGKGVASGLMEEILKIAYEREDIHTVVSVITSGNKASTRLHEKFNFTFCGTIHEVGVKFNEFQDIDNYELHV